MSAREENLAKLKELGMLGERVRSGGENIFELELDFTSETGQKYQGLVTMKYPVLRDLLAIGMRKARYLQSFSPEGMTVPMEYIDGQTHVIARELATLEVCLLQRPACLKELEKVSDFDVIDYLWDKFDAWVGSFRKSSEAKAEGDSEATE